MKTAYRFRKAELKRFSGSASSQAGHNKDEECRFGPSQNIQNRADFLRDKSVSEVAGLVERFSNGTSLYPQEWNDFVDASQRRADVEVYRKRCVELDPLVNRPEGPDPDADAELRSIVEKLRSGSL
jgi:hypothetical protein